MLDTIHDGLIDIYYVILIFAMELFFAMKWGLWDWLNR